MKNIVMVIVSIFLCAGLINAEEVPERSLYWGDTHLHTSYSPDAYFLGNRTADPETAYRFAKGLPIIHPYNRARIQLETPLDFLVVADHAEMLGVPFKLFEGDPRLTNTETGKELIKMIDEGKEIQVFEEFIARINSNKPYTELDTEELKKTIWQESCEIAERYNDPGKFTSFIGWEWTSTPNGNNLHRVVFIPEGVETAQRFVPYSSFDSNVPEDLWAWLEKTSTETGANFVAIPHNSNISGGLMFQEVSSDGKPITVEHALTRMKWEPIVEVTQIKGDSETHPALSPNDEFADFETFSHALSATLKDLSSEGPESQPGDYARSALKRGLEIEQKTGINPYKFGMIGSTDSHTGASTAEETNFWGKVGIDSIPENKIEPLALGIKGFEMSSSGLAGVWAGENTRKAIFEAFQRKEVYATTGPRIQVRFFGGWDFKPKDAKAKGIVNVGYNKGVPMGGDLAKAPGGKSPSFLFRAVKDPKEANLDRVQIVKIYLDGNGIAQEKIYNVALSDDREIDKDGKVSPVGNTVNLKTATYDNSIGDPELVGAWTDSDFDPEARSLYYLRVLQIPTPRHTLYDALALGVEHPTDPSPTIQERAYTSPIWYTPSE